MSLNYQTTNFRPSLRLKAAAELELRRRRRARLSFGDWLAEVTPDYDWTPPHLVHLRGYLEAIERGEINRLMIFEPPRHGKSALATVRYPVWRMQRDPTLSVIVGAYNMSLAELFSRQSRRLAERYLSLDSERKAAYEWTTTTGNIFRAVGVGTGVTGRGARLIVLDDATKSREEANSQAYRDRVWNWYRDDIYTRLEPGGGLVLTQTRWHMDDLAGRILESADGPNWTVVSLPALAEDNDPLGRAPGAALWPARFDEVDLERIRTALGTQSFTALYQQRPTALAGGLFQRSFFEIVNAAPAKARRVRYWDKAASTDKDSDYSCGVLMARDDDGVYYVQDVVRGRWSALARERIIRQTAELDGRDVPVWVEQEPGSGGKESAEATVRSLVGWPIHAERVTGDKLTRAQPLAAQCEARNVKLVRGAWNAAYLDELTMFPNGKHDDQVDATSGAFAKLAKPPQRAIRQYSGY